jgi:hypothetical protein
MCLYCFVLLELSEAKQALHFDMQLIVALMLTLLLHSQQISVGALTVAFFVTGILDIVHKRS